MSITRLTTSSTSDEVHQNRGRQSIGGFHRAAEQLNLTKSTVSRQIRRLELETNSRSLSFGVLTIWIMGAGAFASSTATD